MMKRYHFVGCDGMEVGGDGEYVLYEDAKKLEDMLRRWDKYHRMFDGRGNLAALHSETYALLNKGD